MVARWSLEINLAIVFVNSGIMAQNIETFWQSDNSLENDSCNTKKMERWKNIIKGESIIAVFWLDAYG